MTRRFVYGAGLFCFLATIALTAAAIVIPEWITWVPKVPGNSKQIKYTYGLHTRCSSLLDTCTPFPAYDDCQGPDRSFCSLWRSTGFLMSAAFVLELAALVAFAIPLFGGKQKRERGWQLLCLMLGLCVLCQVLGMGIVAGLHDQDERFFEGWVLGRSFVLCVASWAVQFVVAGGLAASAWLLEEEGGYELIPDRAVG